MKKNLKRILIVCVSIALLLAALVVVLLLPPVQKFILLRVLPDGTSIERVYVGLRGGSLSELKMPLEEGGLIHMPEASFRYKPMRMLTSRTAHLTYLRARHINLELPKAVDPAVAEVDEPKSDELKSSLEEFRELLAGLESMRFKWVLGELAVDGTVLQPDVGLFRFELYGEGFAPGETGNLRTQLEALHLVAIDSVALIGLKSVSTLQFSQSPEGAIDRLLVEINSSANNKANRPVLTSSATVDFAFAGSQRRPQLKLDVNADVTETALFGEAFRSFKALGLELAVDLDAAGDVFVLNQLDMALSVDAQPRLVAGLQHAIRIGEVLPADLELFSLELKALPLEWMQLLAADGPQLSGSPLSAELKVFADGEGGFVFNLPELSWSPLALKDASGDLLLEGLSVNMAMTGNAHPAGAFNVKIAPLVIAANDVPLLRANVFASGHFEQQDLRLSQDFSLRFDGLRQQPVARTWANLIPAEWELMQANMQLVVNDEQLRVETLQASLQAHGGGHIMELAVEQALRLALDEFQLEVADPQQDFARLDLNGFSLSAIAPFLPEGVVIREQGVSGKMRLKAADQRFVLRMLEPLQIANLAVDVDGESQLRQVDATLDLSAEIASGLVLLRDVTARLSTLGNVFFETALDLELPLSDWEPSFDGLRFNGELKANLASLSRQPALAAKLQPLSGLAGARFNGSGLGQSLELDFQLDNLKGATGAPLQLKGNASVQSPDEGVYRLVSRLDWGLVGADKRSALASRLQLKQLPELIDLTGDVHAPLLRLADIEALQGAFVPLPGAPKEAPRPASTPAASADLPEAPWAGFSGDVAVKVDTFELTNGVPITAITARATIREDAVVLSDGKAQLGRGVANANAKVERKVDLGRFDLQADATFSGLEPGYLMGRPGTVQGTFDGQIQVRGQGASLEAAIEAAEVTAKVEGREGLMTLLNLESPATGAAMVGLSLLGGQTRQPGIAAFTRAIPYFNQLRFDRLGLDLRRGSDGLVELNELAMVGPDLAFSGEGSIAAGKWQEMFNQPMRLMIDIGARGQLAESLQTLGLVRATAGTDGFQPATQRLNIGGTLARPDSRAVQDWLWQAAIGAFTGSRSQPRDAEPKTEASPESPARTDAQPREERRPDEIDVGRRLIEGLFGR
jgi:hypothetical protein